jgi:hypothetical protein
MIKPKNKLPFCYSHNYDAIYSRDNINIASFNEFGDAYIEDFEYMVFCANNFQKAIELLKDYKEGIRFTLNDWRELDDKIEKFLINIEEDV